MASSQSNRAAEPDRNLAPSTPPEASAPSPAATATAAELASLASPSLVRPSINNRLPSSQQSIPSTEGPASPVDPSASFRTELYDERDRDRLSPPEVIRSSITPPPSSQAVTLNNTAPSAPLSYANLQRANSFVSAPTTAPRHSIRDRPGATDYALPTPNRIENATVDELRSMLQSCLSINAKLRSENAQHSLQYDLLSMQAVEDAHRAHVEHEMTRREVEVLRGAEDARQARRELEIRVDPIQMKYRELQQAHNALTKEHDDLVRRLKSASRLVQQQAEEIDVLNSDREMLLNRIRENRQHFHMLCGPGGVFHGALTPQTPVTSPQQQRTTPRQTPRSMNRSTRHENEPNGKGFAALLQALKQDDSSMPSTPAANRPPPRATFRQHTRAAHSMSSLPTTPLSRSRGNPGLLPSIDLVPQTEPAQRFGSRGAPQTPTPRKRRKSRESTISAEDEESEEHAHTMTLESVAAAAQSYLSHGSAYSQQRDGEEEEISESQATRAASEMLRRDPRESFEVASSVGSRDVTPVPAEKTNKLQTKLYAPVHKAGVSAEKRKYGGATNAEEDMRAEPVTSPAKKMRYGTDGPIGLGIQHLRRRG